MSDSGFVSVTQRTLDKLKEEWTAPLDAIIATLIEERDAAEKGRTATSSALVEARQGTTNLLAEIATLTAQLDNLSRIATRPGEQVCLTCI